MFSNNVTVNKSLKVTFPVLTEGIIAFIKLSQDVNKVREHILYVEECINYKEEHLRPKVFKWLHVPLRN